MNIYLYIHHIKKNLEWFAKVTSAHQKDQNYPIPEDDKQADKENFA